MAPIFLFIHGYKGSAESLWIPGIRKTLTEQGIKSVSTSYPHPEDPVYEEWRETFLQVIKDNWKGEEIVITAHSLGGYFTLRVFSEFITSDWAKKVVGIVLVGAVTIADPGRRSFYSVEISWDLIKKMNCKIINVHSRDDAAVSVDHPNYIKSKLSDMNGFEAREFDGFGHFQMKEAEPVSQAVFSFT